MLDAYDDIELKMINRADYENRFNSTHFYDYEHIYDAPGVVLDRVKNFLNKSDEYPEVETVLNLPDWIEKQIDEIYNIPSDILSFIDFNSMLYGLDVSGEIDVFHLEYIDTNSLGFSYIVVEYNQG